jgi:hypothetical protein
MRRLSCVVLAVVASTLLAAPASGAPAAHGDRDGCAAFGRNVASLAATLGRDFGANASSVATSGPRAFPTLVVRPEKAALCD